ncbi:MAG: acyl-CoA dehydrogenase family protein, partial [Bdellovibrionales bacterium]|nr:acyl-CoA dehydrogenase family protein [Bdellovibrionales bacterium]
MDAIGFQLTEEQALLRESARRFSAAEIAPHAATFDRSGEFPDAIIRRGYQTGLVNMIVPEALGGGGLGNVEVALVVEELARGCAGITTSMVANDLALTPIWVAGTTEQQRQFITPVIQQQQFASFCLSEPAAGSDVAG